jgi:F420-non-reducing hydrogenase iron-sulfur subunit
MMEQPLQQDTEFSGSEREALPIALPDWEPSILVFACHFCAFAAADLAGVMRLSYSPNIRIIRLPCSGKIDHIYVLRAFERGVDGVFVAG